MNPATLFAMGTILLWVGFVVVLASVANFIRAALLSKTESTGYSPINTNIIWLAIGIGGIAAGLFAAKPASPANTSWALPVIWPIMPLWYWAIALMVLSALYRSVKIISAISSNERTQHGKSLLVLAVTASAIFAAGKLWSTTEFSVLKGAIQLTTTSIAILLLVAILSILGMVGVARSSNKSSWTKAIATHAALIFGSAVFGLPFVFLVVTSFKEDRDMSSAQGIIWIPKVQQTVPYFDPKKPLYEGKYNDLRFEGVIIDKLPDGTVKVDVSKPFSIRGTTVIVPTTQIKLIPRQAALVQANFDGVSATGKVVDNLDDGRMVVEAMSPAALQGKRKEFTLDKIEPIRKVGLRWQNYSEALSFLPPETSLGLVYLRNTLILVVLSVIGTLLSSSIAAYAFSRLKFPGRDFLFGLMLATLMLPGAVTLLPQFLIFKQLGWIDSLKPLWVPAFFGSAFNIFLLKQFFNGIPMELEDAAKIDGCSYFRSFWSVLIPQVKPALAVIAIWTILGAWNNFMGPLIYVNSPEQMPLTYALQLFQSDRGGEPGLLMAFATMAMMPVLLLFFFAQRYFIEGVSLSGLGGR